MKNQIKKNLIVILFGGALVYALNVASAAFVEPKGSAPTNNIDTPVTVLPQSQIKNGGLSVGTFLANGVSVFQQHTFFPGTIKGQDAGGTDAALQIGGTDTTTGTTLSVDATATGNVHSDKSLGSVELVTQKKSRLCGDDQGHVVFCPQLAPALANLINASVSTAPVMGGTRDTNVSCAGALTAPAGPGGESVSLRYVLDRDVNGTVRRYTYCTLDFPEGSQTYDDYPGREAYDGVTVVEACIDSSTVPIDPNGAGLPRC